MTIYGNVTEKEAKVLKVMGCPNSLKSLVGSDFKLIGAVLDNDKKVAEDGSEYTTNFVKVHVISESAEPMWFKFTQTVIAGQIKEIFDNDLAEEDFNYTVDYFESASGNRYLSLII